MSTITELQTITLAYREICEGEDPWIALGNFLHDFFGNFPDQREELIKDSIQEPPESTPDLQRWAVFCAASVEFLCQQYSIPCPDWVFNPAYTLPEPWFHSPAAAYKPAVRARIERETPEPFTRRNVYCGNRVFLNKYEVVANKLQR